MRMRTRGVVAAAAITALGLLAGTGTAEASTVTHTYSRGKVSFKSNGDTITVKDTRSDGYSIWVWVDNQTNGDYYRLQCATSGRKAPVTVKCVRNYPEGHKLRFVVYAEGKHDEIKQGEFTARA
ncbi:hypothetical protein AB0L49_23720 [Streptomyces antimycoticus]|uniref:hypothetical protein n=1 Tax=Streptomyces antimycoticus TaxID=68175 RepID=UPI00343DB609